MNTYANVLVGSMLGFALLGAAVFGLLATHTPSAPVATTNGYDDILVSEEGAPALRVESEAETAAKVSSQPSAPRESAASGILRTLGIGTPAAPAAPSYKALSSFPAADTTWKSRFTNASAPADGYNAYYFDTEKSTTWKSVSPKKVSSVDLMFAWSFDPATGKESSPSYGGGISSENFGGYWIGTFTLAKDQDTDVRIAESWAATRVIIDGREVFDGENQNQSIPVRLPAGKHTMEVEYVNNWHTVGMSVGLFPASSGSADTLAALQKAGAETWRVSVYESGNADNSILLKLPSGNYGPVILYANSYDTVHWDMSGVPAHAIDAIVIGSYTKTANAIHVPEGTTVIYSDSGYYGSGNFDTDSAMRGSISTYNPKALLLPGDAANAITH